jgi:fatty acid-binding protein DegV
MSPLVENMLIEMGVSITLSVLNALSEGKLDESQKQRVVSAMAQAKEADEELKQALEARFPFLREIN